MKLTKRQQEIIEAIECGATLWRSYGTHYLTYDRSELIQERTVKALLACGAIKEHKCDESYLFYELAMEGAILPLADPMSGIASTGETFENSVEVW